MGPTSTFPTRIDVTLDQMGRTVVVIPDADAIRLVAEIKRGWTEIPGVADGYSREFLAGTWVYAITEAILAAIANSETATERDRRAAAEGGAVVHVVGESGWDATTSWWADYPNSRHLHPCGYPGRVHGSDAYRWTG